MDLNDSIEGARELKAMTAADGNEMYPVIMVSDSNGVQLVAVGGDNHPAVNALLVGGQMMATIPDAQELMLVTDAYTTTVDNEGDSPAAGELQERWLSGDRDGITECLICVRAWREEGELAIELIHDPYVHVGTTVQFEDRDALTPTTIEGRIPEALTKAFNSPSMLAADLGELPTQLLPEIEDSERAKELIRFAFLTALASTGGGGCLVPVTESEEEPFQRVTSLMGTDLRNQFEAAWKFAEKVG